MPVSIQSGTATPVNFLLEKGQEVEGINAIESTLSMSGREGLDEELEGGGGSCRLEAGSWVTISQQEKKAAGAFD